MMNDFIDFRLERGRHEKLLGREDVLHELEQLLRRGGEARGWVLVKGSPGMGKSALLAHYLARLEGTGQKVPHHFLRRGVEDWDRPEVVVRNLAAQVEALFPAQTNPGSRPESRLREVLQRVSDEVLVPEGRHLLLLIDGLDEAEADTAGQNPLPRVLPHALPRGVQILCASRPTYPHLSWVEAREYVRGIDLDHERWAASNEQVVRLHWEHVAARIQPRLEPALIERAIQHGGGNILYAVKLFDWLLEQPLERRRAELLPRGLDAFLVDMWQRLHALPTEEQEVALKGLGLIAAARESLPLSLLMTLAGWETPTTGERFRRATRPFLLEEPEHWGGESAWRPFHESFRAFISKMLGAELMRQMHRRLAEYLCQWPVAGAGTEPHRRYALRHGVTHWLGAGEWAGARTLCTDLDHLEAKYLETGAAALEEDLLRAASAADEADQALLREMHRALQSGSHWLLRDPGALGLTLYNWLRACGWAENRLEEVLRFPQGLPALRLRHPVNMNRDNLRTLIGHQDTVTACAVTEDGRRAISASRDRTLKVWELETGRCLSTLVGHQGGVSACALTADGRRAISASHDNTLKVWDLETGRCVATLKGHQGPVLGCAVTPDGRRAVSTSEDLTLKVWDLETGRDVLTLRRKSDRPGCAMTADGRRAVSGLDATLGVWDLEAGKLLETFSGHFNSLTGCALTPDGRRAVSSAQDWAMRVWEVKTGKTLATCVGHRDVVNGCAITADGRRAVSASEDRTLKVWDVATGRCLATLEGHEAPVTSCVVTGDGRRALSTSRDRTLKVWDLEELSRAQATPEQPRRRLRGCVVAATPSRALSASRYGTLTAWDLETGRNLATLVGHQRRVLGCAVTPDGRRALSASFDHTLKVWNLETGTVLATLQGHKGAVTGCVIWADGQRALSASYDGTLRVWDLEKNRALFMLDSSWGDVTACAVTPDGRRAISASSGGRLKLWDLEKRQGMVTLEAHASTVTACAVTADGRRAISASEDKTLKVWDLETQRLLLRLEGHRDSVTGCGVLAGGRQVVSSSLDGTLKVWDLHSGQCVQTLHTNGGFFSVTAVQDVICAADHFGNVWMLETNAKSRPPPPPPRPSRASTDLGIVIALKEEFRVFQELLPVSCRSERDEKTGQYTYAFELPGLPYRCVVTFIGEMNPEPAALCAERLIDRWEPRTVVMLGIAAGIHPDVRLGDVIVASQIDDYLASARAQPGMRPGAYEFALGGTVYQGDHDFITRVRHLEFAEREVFLEWSRNCEKELRRHLSEEARVRLVEQRLVRPVPELLDVHLACGSVVGAAREFNQWLREKRDRNLKALDMESAGLVAATFKRIEPKRTLVIRGISDYGDERKSTLDALGEGALRRQAMHNATTLLWTLLKAGVLPRAG